ncbi:unnamed protein product [Phytomonas sp. EM1]|nr:unnamed protein product [Phytomonas sp. EM1]|eukprot:CCW60469.1 unnamed protein product [Phytomonas sp. isolate EM1]
MYSLSSNAAREISNLLSHMCGIKPGDDWKPTLLSFCHLITIILFVSHEIFLGSGFDTILLFKVFIFLVRGLRSSSREVATVSNKFSAYTDLFYEALWMIVPPVSVNFLYIAFHMHSFDFMKEILRAALGCLYVVAYLDRFTPNLYSNLRNKTCKVAFCYQNTGGGSVSKLTLFIQTELTFLVDDIFIFTCRIPSIYRIVVFASHTLYLLQYFFFTREFPQAKVKGHQGGESFEEKYPDSQKAIPQNHEAMASRELNEADIRLLSHLDQEPTYWLDVPRSKYNSVMRMMVSNLVDRGENIVVADFTCTSDMENIAFFLLDKRTQAASGMFLIPDPPMARLIGLECDPLQSAPSTQRERSDIKYLKASYLRSLGPEANLTASEVWRRRKNILETGTPAIQSMSQSFFYGVLFFLLVLLFRFLMKISPDPIELLDCLKSAPASMQPLRVSRFSSILPREHSLNRANTGLLTFWDSHLVFCAVDFWDSYRQLLFHTNP